MIIPKIVATEYFDQTPRFYAKLGEPIFEPRAPGREILPLTIRLLQRALASLCWHRRYTNIVCDVCDEAHGQR